MNKPIEVLSKHELNSRLNDLKPSATLAINELSSQLKKQGRDVYKLGFGQSPFPVPAIVVEALRDNAHQKDYLPVVGLEQLRQQIASNYAARYGISRTADDILIGPGSKELIFTLQVALDAHLILPSPSWVSYAPQAQIAGSRTSWINTTVEEDWSLNPSLLDQFCEADSSRSRLLLINYPNNPTGATFDEKQLIQLAEVCRKHNLIVLSDEIYGETHFEGQHRSLASYYPEGTIISTGLSKWCGAGGWRIGTFIVPPELSHLRKAMAIIASETFTSVSAPIQHAAIRAYQGGAEIDRYLESSRQVLKAIGGFTQRFLIDNNVLAAAPKGGFYVFPDFREYKAALAAKGISTSDQLCHRMLEEIGVALLPGSAFGRPLSELTTRLSYVDFDGQTALNYAQQNAPLTSDRKTMAAIAPQVMLGLEKMIAWLYS
ncbi:MAG: aminotransferase class I/II-fold pyridoxal phosphate-dependent enzyme [Cyclobacteriaceae bacterium]